MLRSYLTVAARAMRRHFGFAFINVLGLSIGLAISFVIMAWVHDERSVDRFHEDVDRIYQVMRVREQSDGSSETSRSATMPMAEVLETEFPEVEHAVLTSWQQEFVITSDGFSARERGYQAGPAFFEIFSFPLIRGEASTVLEDPASVVISRDLAARHFGADWETGPAIVGRTLRIDDRQDFVISGVFESVPSASSLQFDFILHQEDFFEQNPWVDHWGNFGMELFVQLVPSANPDAFSDAIRPVIARHHENSSSWSFLQWFGDRHLWTRFEQDVAVGGRIGYVRVLMLAALLILIVASINFTNLTTARSSKRAREIGIRKSIGSTRTDLIRQFLGESVLVAGLSAVVALGMVSVLAPYAEPLTGKLLVLGQVPVGLWALFAGTALATGFVAGLYPALFLSGVNPTRALRSAKGVSPGDALFRKGLVVVQFAVSVVLVVGALSVQSQLRFIADTDLGFEREGLVMLPFEGQMMERPALHREALKGIPGVIEAATISQHPLSVNRSTGDVEWPGKDEADNTNFALLHGSHGLGETLGLDLLAGRFHDERFETTGYLLNEEAVRVMGLQDPLGTEISVWGQEGPVIGLLEDFNSQDLFEAIRPMVMRFSETNASYMLVRADMSRIRETIASMEEVHQALNPAFPFEYAFVDDEHHALYEADRVLGRLSVGFTLVALLVSIIGLLGLAAHATERRTREIGVRKVLGASVPSIMRLVTGDLLRPVIWAIVLAVPPAYYLVGQWLERYSYHVSIAPSWFVWGGAVVLIFSVMAASLQTVRVATSNPSQTLRTAE